MVQYKQCASSLSVNSAEMTSEFFTAFDYSIFLKVCAKARCSENQPLVMSQRGMIPH